MTICSFVDTAPLDSLLRHVLPVLPEVPYSVGVERIRQAYIEFARRTSIVSTKLIQDFQAGVVDYSLDPPDGYQVYEVISLEDSVGFRPSDYWNRWRNCPKGFRVVENKYIILDDAPSVDIAGGLSVWVQLIPTEDCECMPVSISTPFGITIASGAIRDLLRVPNKPWSNWELSKVYEMEFNRGILSAKTLSDNNRVRGPMRAKPIRIL